MADNRYRPVKGVYPPEELRGKVSELIQEVGVRALSRRLGVHREQLISIAAGIPVLEGTLALMRERLRADAERGAA